MKNIDNIYLTIDLWTEPNPNNKDCFEGALTDGFSDDSIPYNKIKIVTNCVCIIENNKDLKINNKNNAIIFYLNEEPVRLLVACKDTNITSAVYEAIKNIKDKNLKNYIYNIVISSVRIDKNESINEKYSKEIDVGSCDRLSLLKSMLDGCYTESDTSLGKNIDDLDFYYDEDTKITYNLETNNEIFYIEHKGAFINKDKSRIIPIQKNSKLNKELEDSKKIYIK